MMNPIFFTREKEIQLEHAPVFMMQQEENEGFTQQLLDVSPISECSSSSSMCSDCLMQQLDNSEIGTHRMDCDNVHDEENDLQILKKRRHRQKDPNKDGHGRNVYRYGELLLGVVGVYAAYLIHGLVQEKLYRYRSLKDGTTFRFVWFLQVLESTASIGLGLVGRCINGGRKDLPLRPFLLSGISQVLAKVFCSLSLASGTSFPVTTLAKSAKVVPVMIGQLILGGSTYESRDYVFAGLLVSGTVLLSLGTRNYTQTDESSTTTGIAFVIMSLVMDGCTGGLQKQLKKDTAATPPTTYDFLLYTHISMFATALLVALSTGDLIKGVAYSKANPDAANFVVQLCALSVIGQSFIFYVIASFDPLVCATVTTTRKMFSVLLSIFLYQHQLTVTGYGGLGLALAGLMVEVQGKVFAQQSPAIGKAPHLRKTRKHMTHANLLLGK